LSRLNYQESFLRARSACDLTGRPKPEAVVRPRHDDEDLGPSIFKYRLEDCDLGQLTLYGLFIGRSELRKVQFRGTDLHLSTFCWNDFIGCDFSEADLSQSDLRASTFDACSFRDANLEGCDFRQSMFDACLFEGARMSGAVLTFGQEPGLNLSPEQRKSIRWTSGAGREAEGG
jgi:uncharacterized protein YjbI with pentapeptide repeats